MTFTKRIFVAAPTFEQFREYQEQVRSQVSDAFDMVFLNDVKQMYGFRGFVIHFVGDMKMFSQEFLQDVTNIARLRNAEIKKV